MPQTLTFNANRDKELITAGTHFYCIGCLMARPLGDQSPDPRYCQVCYDFLTEEAKSLSAKRAEWIPRAEKAPLVEAEIPLAEHTPQGQAGHNSEDTTATHVIPIENYVPIPQPPEEAEKRRGPRYQSYPEERIRQLAEDNSSREIAAILTANGLHISYKTVQRILSGERQLVLPINNEKKGDKR